ncbi:MAG: hypothetical protein MUC58_03045 [Rhizobiaceae bacterium]|nr:hypothetical protein [Rhizobiaceae bacterium]
MSHAMKIALAASALSFAAAAPSFAACSTPALAGQWLVVAGDGIPIAVTVSATGTVTGPLSGRVALSAACKLTGALGNQAVDGRTDGIGTGPAIKPNIMLGRYGAIDGFIGYRR